jgi:putative membrane protein
MKHPTLALFVTAALASAAAVAQTPPTDRPADRSTTDRMDRPIASPAQSSQMKQALPVDTALMKQLAIGGMTEVEAGKLAAQKGQSKEVKEFGEHMVNDHSKSNSKLKALAEEKNVELPAKLDAKHAETKVKLEQQSSANFDAAYMAAMVEAHENTTQLLQHQINAGKDAKIKQFATETLPTVSRHLEKAKQLQAKINPAERADRL